jgi:hypothetical protein
MAPTWWKTHPRILAVSDSTPVVCTRKLFQETDLRRSAGDAGRKRTPRLRSISTFNIHKYSSALLFVNILSGFSMSHEVLEDALDIIKSEVIPRLCIPLTNLIT